MKVDYKRAGMMVLFAAVTAICLVAFYGCSKAESSPPVSDLGLQQKTCPVMVGTPINKNIYTDYKGKRVYFCCPSCKTTFRKDPEKYIGNLPQFAN
jgi:YHS domain-containing protein